ncbi:hypothetical protein [Pseudactinotalea sp. Z1732]|uniref:hypothetical protein n=1 Tax=Micrococcales TaxID=85006 RepID=UPI003C79B707
MSTHLDAPLVHALLTGETGDPRLTPNATPRTRAAIEDAAFMAHTGETLPGAAKRLGLSVNGLKRMLHRHGQHRIASRLRTNTTQKGT